MDSICELVNNVTTYRLIRVRVCFLIMGRERGSLYLALRGTNIKTVQDIQKEGCRERQEMTRKMKTRQRWRILSNMEMSFGFVMKEQACLVVGGERNFLETLDPSLLCKTGSLSHLNHDLGHDSEWPSYVSPWLILKPARHYCHLKAKMSRINNPLRGFPTELCCLTANEKRKQE